MADSLLTITIYIMCGLCLLQPNLNRGVISGLFGLFILIQDVIFINVDGMAYFLSAGICDLIIIAIISKVTPTSILCYRLQVICLASIVLNLIGLLMWYSYMEPHFYNWSFVVLNSYAIYCLTRREPGYGGRASDNNGNSIVFRHNHFSS